MCLDLLAKDVLAKKDAIYAVSLCARVTRLVSKCKGELLVSSLEVLIVSVIIIVKLYIRLRNKGLKLYVS